VMRNGHAADIRPRDVEAVCMKCHDGLRASAEAHPVGRPATSATPVPKGWPAPDGQVTCITCHRVHAGGRRWQPRPERNPAFLREYDGDLLSFCGRCHAGHGPTAGHLGRYNPHLAMLSPEGRPVQESCAFCHSRPMPSGPAAVRTGRADLHTDGVTLCLGCHSSHPDWFSPGHVGAKVTPTVRAAMTAFEARQAASRPATTRPTAEATLPLGGRNADTLVCATCHNPHQVGVFPADSALGRGAMRAGQATDALRGQGKELCGVCHAK
ncbi:MAG: hypothetical protein HRF43_08080, partial [Phycisphaerae bacterium]